MKNDAIYSDTCCNWPLNWLQNFPQAPEHNFAVARLLLAQLKPENKWIDELSQWVELRLHHLLVVKIWQRLFVCQ